MCSHKNMCLAQILNKILRILSFGGHLGRHLEYFNFPNDAKVASFSFNVRTYWRTHLCKNILCGLFLGLHPKSSFGNRTSTHLSKPIHITSAIHRTIKVLRESYYLSHNVFMKQSWENRAILVRLILRLSLDSSY